MLSRRVRSFILGTAGSAAIASCTPFASSESDGATPDGGARPPAVDASHEAGSSCTRAPFSDAFVRDSLAGPGWQRVPDPDIDGLVHSLDSTVHTGDGRSLKVVVSPRGSQEQNFFARDVDIGACPIQLSFDLRIGTRPPESESLVFAAIELAGERPDVGLHFSLHGGGLDVVERSDGERSAQRLDTPALDGWTRIVLRFDPLQTPPVTEITVGSGETVRRPALLADRSRPRSVRIGAVYASRDADAAVWIDSVTIE